MATSKWPLTPAEISAHAVAECAVCGGNGIAQCIDADCYDFDCPGEFICGCVRIGHAQLIDN